MFLIFGQLRVFSRSSWRLFMKKNFFGFAKFLATFIALAAFLATPVLAGNEAGARQLAERAFVGKKIDAFRQLPNLPFYEIWIGRNLVYTDLEAKVLIVGNLLEAGSLSNLREARLAELTAIQMKDLPLANAIKTVRGSGKNKLVVFADANCGYCKKYEAELKTLDNVTIYTVMYPVLSADSKTKARATLCANNPAQVWNDWMIQGKAMPKPANSCQPPIDQIIEFGRKNDIGVTPTTFLQNGKKLPGFLPIATLKKELESLPR
jgi:thiol:disulfide interchange protein DsbC